MQKKLDSYAKGPYIIERVGYVLFMNLVDMLGVKKKPHLG
jgi:hypothetical protein